MKGNPDVICYTSTNFVASYGAGWGDRKATSKLLIYDLQTHQIFKKKVAWETCDMKEAEILVLSYALRFLNAVHITTASDTLLISDSRTTVDDIYRFIRRPEDASPFMKGLMKPMIRVAAQLKELGNTVTIIYSKGYNIARHLDDDGLSRNSM